MSRQRRPAPPLVLHPVLVRLSAARPEAARLQRLADLLGQRGLLTDGGQLSRDRGLRGRGGMMSLQAQDVRAVAHALVLELWQEAEEGRWSELADDYFQRYDRGKRRRPHRLQRLYLEWSADLGWRGLLQACRRHPRLYGELRQALLCLDAELPERRWLEVALRVLQGEPWSLWRELHEQLGSPAEWLDMLVYLPSPTLRERLWWLDQEAPRRAWPTEAVLLSCRALESGPLEMPAGLVERCLTLLEQAEHLEPSWLAVLRPYRWPRKALERLWSACERHPELARIRYGARPGRSWLEDLRHTLESHGPLSGELPSVPISP